MRSFRLKSVLLFFAAILAATCARPATAAMIVGGSALLDTTSANQLEAWLGEGAIEITRIYAKESGDTAGDFHNAVDGQGRTFSVIEVRAANGISHQIVGGYNPQSWSSIDGWHLTPSDVDRTAFLFNLTSNEIQRQNLIGQGPSNAGHVQTYNGVVNGPSFGGGYDTGVNNTLDAGSAYNYSYGGTSYTNDILQEPGSSHNFLVGQIEVFTIRNVTTAAVPEPASLLAWSAFGLIGLTFRTIRRRQTLS